MPTNPLKAYAFKRSRATVLATDLEEARDLLKVVLQSRASKYGEDGKALPGPPIEVVERDE